MAKDKRETIEKPIEIEEKTIDGSISAKARKEKEKAEREAKGE